MPLSAPLIEPDPNRRVRILLAAERAFARHGFHGASMQHVAAEAKMSAGNLYRYFGSKEAIVSGLAERDQAALTEDFGGLAASRDILGSVEGLLRKHLVDEPIERGQLCLEIWAEAARNEAVAQLCLHMEAEIRARLEDVMAAGGLGERRAEFAARVMLTVVTGLLKRRAIDPDFDGEAEVALALGVFRALLDGSVKPYRAEMELPA